MVGTGRQESDDALPQHVGNTPPIIERKGRIHCDRASCGGHVTGPRERRKLHWYCNRMSTW